MIEHRPELFESNLALWFKSHKEIPKMDASSFSFCKTGKKEQLNLYNKDSNTYLYSAQNIDVEVRQWIGLFDPNKIEWVVVYGVGLGYYYLGLKSWLEGNIKRQVIFIEDDPSVLQAFLATDAAEKLLQDAQAHLIYLEAAKFHVFQFEEFIQKSLFRQIHIGALASYQKDKFKTFEEISFLIQFYRAVKEPITAEYLTHGKTFFTNYYQNILGQDHSFNGVAFINQFKGIPAIICGAGPSLEKNIEVLKTLKDRALIFAGGTAMNALNSYHFLPHFGCGIDPFGFHYSRILSNIAFETPFFYRSRMNAEAVALLHGPKIYASGTTGYPIAEWMDEKLGYSSFKIDEGSNVVNTSLSIAEKLGCNPIIIVGLDLAYTDGLSYPPGLKSHAIYDPREQFITKAKGDELVLVKDIYNQPVYTLMKWLIESSWYGAFAKTMPHIKVINCTEGGIGFSGIENMPLKEAARLYLTDTLDCDGKIASVLLSESADEKPPFKEIKKAIGELVKSLTRCGELFKTFQNKFPEIWIDKSPSDSLPLQELEKELKEQMAYKYLLKPFDDVYKKYMQIEASDRLDQLSGVQEVLKGRLPYLADIVLMNLHCIEKAMKQRLSWEKGLKVIHPNPEIPVLEEAQFSSNTECSTHYYKNGQILSQIMYKNGIKSGRAQTFTSDGKLLSDREFKNGLEEGTHLYYYPSGKLKSQIPYTLGLLNGKVMLYYSNGALKRVCSYQMGKREGIDALYSINGAPLLQGEYSCDLPLGKAVMWHMDGSKAKEISYLTPGLAAQIKEWDESGHLMAAPQSRLDYMDTAVFNTLELHKSISGMKSGIEGIVHALKGHFSDQMNKDLDLSLLAISQQLDSLKNLSEKLLKESGVGGMKESIWKTRSNELELNAFLQGITFPMQESILKLQWKLRSMIQSIEQSKKTDEL